MRILSILALVLGTIVLAQCAFLEQELPLQVLSIHPDEKRSLLKGTDPITVVFTRPVIALDFEPGELQLDESKIPFTLTRPDGSDLGVPGKMRWPTTYTARFDPDEAWPTDLIFNVNINSALTSFDGMPLKGMKDTVMSQEYTTSPLKVDIGSVTSKKASELTDNTWTGGVGDEKFREVPPDGVFQINFDYPVSPPSIQAALQIISKGSTSSVDFKLTSCTDGSALGNKLTRCIQVEPSNLQANTRYTFSLPEGTIYNQLAGPLKKESSVTVSGLYPFTFTPLRYTQSASNINYDFYLRHGLSEDTNIDDFQSALRLTDMSAKRSVPFSVSRPSNSTLRVTANYEPNHSYQFLFNPSNKIKDGFSQAMASSTITVEASDTQTFFKDIFGGYSINNEMVIEASEATKLNDAWTILSKVGEKDGYSYSLVPVLQADMAAILGNLGYNSFQATKGLSTAARAGSSTYVPVKKDYTEATIPIRSNFFIRSVESLNWNKQKDIQNGMASISDLAITYDSVGSNALIWVTRMSDASVVPGAKVSIYQKPNHSWPKQHKPSKFITTGSTDSKGTYSWDFSVWQANGNGNGNGDLQIVVELGREAAYLEKYFYHNNVDSNPSTTAEIITDLATYKPGAFINLKAYVRQFQDEKWMLPENLKNYQIEIEWNPPQAPEWRAVKDTFPAHFDSLYGSFDTTLQIPENATLGSTCFRLQSKQKSWWNTLTTKCITIADPRRPTVTLDVDTSSSVYVISKPFDISATVLTGTGQPVNGASVKVDWTLTRQPDLEDTLYIALPRGLEQESSSSSEGSFTMATDVSGEATEDFSAILRDALDKEGAKEAKEGDDFRFEFTYVGPTGEVLDESLSAPVQVSEWTVDLDISTGWDSPIPGLPFDVSVSVTDADGAPVDTEVTVELREKGEGNRGKVVKTCVASSTAPEPQCADFVLPSATEYVIVASTQDTDGTNVEDESNVGNSKEWWSENPLRELPDVSYTLDKDAYVVGDVARLTVRSVRTGGKALIRVGPSGESSMRTMGIVDLDQGVNVYQIPVDQMCGGGCVVRVALSIPRQSSTFMEQFPDDLLFSKSYDPLAPTYQILNTDIEVAADVLPYLDVDVTVPKKASPGEEVTIDIKLSRDGKPALGEVAIMVVDQAFLDLKPNPLIQPYNYTAGNDYISTDYKDSRQNLANVNYANAALEQFNELIARDPWVQPDWSKWSSSMVDDTNEEYLNSRYTTVTETAKYFYNNDYNAASYGGGYGGGFPAFEMDVHMAMPTAVAYSVPVAMNMEMDVASDEMAMGSSRARAKGGIQSVEGTSSDGAGGDREDVPVRSRFEISPLFIGKKVVNGNTQVSFKLPGNIGSYSVRVYAVDNKSAFGASEDKMVATKPVVMQSMLPRFVRASDNFKAGVIVAADDADFNDVVTVTFQTLNRTIALMEPESGAGRSSLETSVQLVGTTPVKVSLPMAALSVGQSGLEFMVKTTVGSDGLEDGFPVEPTQDPVQVATSMAIEANVDGAPWKEKVEIPSHIKGTGTLSLKAGVGHYPAVLDAAELVFERQGVPTNTDASLWVSRNLIETVVDTYGGLDSTERGSIQAEIVKTSPITADALTTLTDEKLGLRWSSKRPPSEWEKPSASLNTYALYAKLRELLEEDPNSIKRSPFYSGPAATNKKSDATVKDVDMNDAKVKEVESPMIMDGYWGGYEMAEPDIAYLPAVGRGRGLLQRMAVPMMPPPTLVMGGKPAIRPVLEEVSPISSPTTTAKTSANDELNIWAEALSTAMTYSYYDALRYGGTFNNWDSVASTLVVLGLKWVGDDVPYEYASGDPSSVLNLEALLQNFEKLSPGGQVDLALAYLLRPDDVDSDEFVEVVGEVVNRILSDIRLQGRTAYIPASDGSPHAAPLSTQSKALTVLSLYDQSHPFVEKLAAYVAEGGKQAGRYYSWSPQDKALASLSLSDYDYARGSRAPNLNLAVTAAKTKLLDASFTSPDDPVVEEIIPMQDLPVERSDDGDITPSPLEFVAKGEGEASVAVMMDFVPATMSPDPTYRGLYVERLVQKMEGDEGVGSNVQVTTPGEFYTITIQVTTPDDLVGVQLEDLLPGGFEAIDPNLSSGNGGDGLPSLYGGRICWWCQRRTFRDQQTEKERVTWYADSLEAGTHSVSYKVLANTPGVFLHPPTRAYSTNQPELMGLSGGSYVVVSSTPVDNEEEFLKENGIPIVTISYPQECAVECDSDSTCNISTGKCEKIEDQVLPAPKMLTWDMSSVDVDVQKVATAKVKKNKSKNKNKKGGKGKKGKGKNGKKGKGKGNGNGNGKGKGKKGNLDRSN